ncbi:hypothetical protein [Vibrio parahaemolyticus]|uniref:hypothetical protein n=1 Tax=Vibrio parahaemolyticus TaxID=670 RepID=UPI00084A8A52|nr:hypothetical protein [Vibrio parahaemolyticus]ODZ11033.1 hypothetical protein BBM99_05510 [Vibrio parahaemolyticus]
MTIKITEQNNQILVRRWKYSKEKKRSLPTSLYSVSKYSVPDELPEAIVSEHEVTKEEQQTFIDFVEKLNEEKERTSAKVSLWMLTDNLNKAKSALIDPELRGELKLEQYEELSETVNEIKKLITKNKNALKRKEAAK